ncbi:MAG: hypothetical protein OXH57_02565 [Ekhidna sp.]|nr:hypothetical protein [Ekhidna sp.]
MRQWQSLGSQSYDRYDHLAMRVRCKNTTCALYAACNTKLRGIKKTPENERGATQMFSQRNNPYCDFL